jgi:enhancer of polycomb-like protein
MPKSPSDLSDWLFPVVADERASRRRPTSIDEEEEEEEEEEEADWPMVSGGKKRKYDEMWRYDADSGGAIGVGMGVSQEDDRVVIDDLDLK